MTEPSTVVQEWRITGDPGRGYPYYVFVFRSDDPRWVGNAEQKAKAQHAAMAEGTWDDGPYLQHRTVTYTPWVELRGIQQAKKEAEAGS